MKDSAKTSFNTLNAISLFSNCGAGDLGYKNAGFQFRVMAELDSRRLDVALLNHPEALGIHGDLRDTWRHLVIRYFKLYKKSNVSLLAACPPCQGMSTARGNRGSENDPDAGSKDERNLLVVVIAKVVKELLPSIVVVENVPAFLTRKVRHPHTREPISAANLLISYLETFYEAFPILVDLCDYGVPQTRKRAFITFIRRDVEGLNKLLSQNRSPYPRPTHALEYGGHPIKLKEALNQSGFPSLDAISKERASIDGYFGLHSVPVWKQRQYKMVAAIPPHSGASAWENNECEKCGEVDANENDVYCPKCNEPLLRPIVKDKNGTHRFIKGFRSSSYRRMSPDKPASTVTTASGHVGSDITIHPYENRILSPLECSYLQTFPRDFNWGNALKKWGHTNVREMIGEAVPPLFTHLHGKVLKSILTNKWTIAPISLSDQRCTSAQSKLTSQSKLI